MSPRRGGVSQGACAKPWQRRERSAAATRGCLVVGDDEQRSSATPARERCDQHSKGHAITIVSTRSRGDTQPAALVIGL